MAMRIAGQPRIEPSLVVHHGLPAFDFVWNIRVPFAGQVVIPGFVVKSLVKREAQDLIAETLAHQYLDIAIWIARLS